MYKFFSAVIFFYIFSACEEQSDIGRTDLANYGMTFGGNQVDIGYFGQKTKDGGFVIAGLTKSYAASGTDVWLIKTDQKGQPEWDKTYGGLGEDYGLCVKELDNGGYVVVGSALIKTQSQGTEVWTNEEISGNALQIDGDGGFIIVGVLNDNISIIKTNSDGVQMWTKQYNIDNVDIANSIEPASDGCFIISGCTDCESYPELFLMKINELGDSLWTKIYGGSENESGAHAIEAEDGGFIVTGHTGTYGDGLNDLWLLKTDSAGDSVWTQTHGGSSLDEGTFIQQTDDGGYIITGINFSLALPDYGDAWLLKTDSLGLKIWENTFGGVGLDWGRTVQVTEDGGYAITGWRENVLNDQADSQVWLILTDSQGQAEPTGQTN